MIKVGIIGAAGYTAGELLRLLVHHPEVQVVLAQSDSQQGKKVTDVHKDLLGDTNLTFTGDYLSEEVTVYFLCKGHGESKKIIQKYPKLLDKKIIDLSHDYRLKSNHDFVYGLPEVNRSTISSAKHIANPGCFATCIQLGLLPSVAASSIEGAISISGITGSTGAGQKPTATTHFSWRSNNASVYKPLKHQHLLEINETFDALAHGFDSKLLFVPYRGAFTRGIITTAHFSTECSTTELMDHYDAFYESTPFVHVVEENPDVKQVVGTNKCLVFPQVIEGTAIIVSVIDNLIKGASGQAVQNMNLQFGLQEDTGLKLKSTVF